MTLYIQALLNKNQVTMSFNHGDFYMWYVGPYVY